MQIAESRRKLAAGSDPLKNHEESRRTVCRRWQSLGKLIIRWNHGGRSLCLSLARAHPTGSRGTPTPDFTFKWPCAFTSRF